LLISIDRPIFGLIFLFKWIQETEAREGILTEYDPELYFANQVINNACATQAILSILMNRNKDIEIGDELKNLRSFSMEMNSKDRGWAIGNSELIRETHNGFHRQEPFEIE
jgi:ubiquitin carboxyl-terminal hydrolase L5